MKANIGIKEENLAAVAHSLGKILADEFVLYTCLLYTSDAADER
nr:hypothetical protein [Pedobacter sp. ASV19]